MANGDPLRAAQSVDCTGTTTLDCGPFPTSKIALLVRNTVYRPAAPQPPTPWASDYIAVQAEGTTGIFGSSYNAAGAGVAGEARSTGGIGVYGHGGNIAVWGNGVPVAKPYGSGFSAGSQVGVVGDAVGGVGVFGSSWFSFGVLGRNENGGSAGVRGESRENAGVEGVSDDAPGVFGQSTGGVGTGGRSVKDAGASGTSQDGPGVRGYSANRSGVQGSSEGFKGVEGVGPVAGVDGRSSRGAGVNGQTESGVGVLAQSTARTGVALRARASRRGGLAGDFLGDVHVSGALLVMGAKSAVVPGADGRLKQWYCTEAPEPLFEDVGEAVLKAGAAEVVLDPSYVSATGGRYQVFLTAYAPVQLYVSARRSDRFTVRLAAESGKARGKVSFGWRVVARRADVKSKRFASVEWPLVEVEEQQLERMKPPAEYALSPRAEVPTRKESPLGEAIATRLRRPATVKAKPQTRTK